ncbi:hypothetical protein BD408DRAFT_5257 [Parasitella parasitica]|nr:hypothetical protein BD408DRAFT_5257 [Parasitella parasitica]
MSRNAWYNGMTLFRPEKVKSRDSISNSDTKNKKTFDRDIAQWKASYAHIAMIMPVFMAHKTGIYLLFMEAYDGLYAILICKIVISCDNFMVSNKNMEANVVAR